MAKLDLNLIRPSRLVFELGHGSPDQRLPTVISLTFTVNQQSTQLPSGTIC